MLHSIRVSDYMAKRLIVLQSDMSIDTAIKLLLRHGVSGAPVLNEIGELVGMFSESDCLKDIVQSCYHETNAGMVKDVMFTQIQSIHPDQSILDAAEIFLKDRRRRLPVLDDQGRLVGQISRRDVLRAMDELSHQPLEAHRTSATL